ncbi:MAG: RsmB/NOP family class I SAM-dependent RNA methyltransferase [Clostridia bacterium]
MSERYPLPPRYAEHIREQLGVNADAYFAALEQPYLRGLRLNPRKLPVAMQGMLSPIPWCAQTGRYLALESLAGASPLHEAGAYYLQEPSAMAPVAVLCPQPGERVLDLCAAPGGKSTQIADALAGRGLLVSNEPVPSRARVLSRNVERMGVCNALVVSAEPEKLAARWLSAFDAVLVDAPCSGEGMFRRHPEARAEWNEQSPAGCAVRQRHILASAWRMLKAGGRLVYSTCTFSAEENEQVIEHLLATEPDAALIPFSLPVGDGRVLEAPNGTLRLYPHQIKGEGHFMAFLRKRGNPQGETAFLPAAERLHAPTLPLLAAYAAFASSFPANGLPKPTAQLGDTLLCAPELPSLDSLTVLRAGLQLGTLKGKVFAPDHALAMGLALPYALPTVPLDVAGAHAYQAGETLPVPDTLAGYALPTYCGLALGFGKASGGQLKNHYPKGLRRP